MTNYLTRRQRRFFESALSVMTYSSCSVSMILLNKLLMYTFNLPFPNSLLFCQNCAAFLLVSFAKYIGLISFPDFSWTVTRRWLPLTLLFVAMLFTSMKSLHTMSVSAQTILKNLAVIITAYGDVVLYGKKVTVGMYVAFMLMIIGSYLSAYGDQWVTSWGLFWTFANITSTVCYTLYMKRLLKDFGASIGRYGPVFYNNLLSLPFFIIGGWNEFAPLFVGLSKAPWEALVCFIVITSISAMMSFGVFWCM